MSAKIQSFSLSEDKKRLFSNFFYLFALQGANYVLPFLTLPYLIRVLGTENFGLFAFSQAFISYFMTLTDYGFYLSATRDVSVNRDNTEKLSEIFSSVMILKFSLMLISFIIMAVIVLSVEKFRVNWLFYLCTFGMILGGNLFPSWFFQGMEKMKYVTLLNILSKVIFTVSMFFLIKAPSDAIYAPALTSLGYLIAGIIALSLLFGEFKIKLYLPSFRTLWSTLKESTGFFLSRVAVIFYTTNNTFILGLVTNNHMVGYYATAEKLNYALKSMYYPLSDNLYPYMSKQKNIKLFKKIFWTATFFNTILCIGCFVFADLIIKLIFGSGLQTSANVFKILSFIAIFSVPATLMGYPLLGSYGKSKLVNSSYIIGSIIHVIGLSILMFLSKINIYTIAGMVLTTEIFVLIIRSYFVMKTDFSK